ncbi:MAG: MBL fold metallo-hydrolase [Candidatus Aminicenantes bacterium]|nr:MAG: MBL fold metallo-hydrolase [Candidatus Aminicenantes bacterium]
MTIDRIALKHFEIYGLRDGFFCLDGGAMFGVVPKVLWEKKYPPDRFNRIKFALNSILINTRNSQVLVDTGVGVDLDQKSIDIFSFEREPGLIPSLQKLGYEAKDIDLVVNTHLHFDHCGGNTFRNEKGEYEPTFPKAKYIIQKGEWEYAINPCYRDKPSYHTQNFLPLEKYGLVQFVEGDKEIIEGVEVILVPGHTSHHQCVKVCSEGMVLFFMAELIPTSAHMGLSYIMSYDLFPLETLENKKKLYDQAIKEDWIVAFDHDPQHYFGKIKKIDDKYKFEPLS